MNRIIEYIWLLVVLSHPVTLSTRTPPTLSLRASKSTLSCCRSQSSTMSKQAWITEEVEAVVEVAAEVVAVVVAVGAVVGVAAVVTGRA